MEIIFKTIFVAVPDFMRVEPVMISEPTSIGMSTSTFTGINGSGLQMMYAVLEPIFFAYSNAETT